MDQRQLYISELKRAALALVTKGGVTNPNEVFQFLKEEMNKNSATKNHASIGYMDLLIKQGKFESTLDLVEFIKHIK